MPCHLLSSSAGIQTLFAVQHLTLAHLDIKCGLGHFEVYIGLLNLIDHGDVFGFVFTKFGSAMCGSTRAKLGIK